MRVRFAAASALVGGLVILLVSAPGADAAAGYSYSVVGNPADVVTPTSGLWSCKAGAPTWTRTSCAWGPARAAATSS